MSVAQFSPILRDRIIKLYASDNSDKIDLANFRNKTRRQIFKEVPETKQLRKKFEAADFHTSSLTIDGISALSNKLIETLEDTSVKQIVSNFFNNPNFFSNFTSFIENKKGYTEYSSTDIRLENVPQDTLKNYFLEYIEQNLRVPPDVIKNIRDNIQSGHLAGVFLLKLKTALGVKISFSENVEASYRDFSVSMEGLEDTTAIKTLDTILKAVLDADFLTSSLITESQIFLDATKFALGDNPRLITELQFTEDNKKAGDALQQTGKYLNNLIQASTKGELSASNDAIKGLIKSLQPVVDIIFAKVEELKEPLKQKGLYDKILQNANYLATELINAPGSVSIKQGIEKSIANVIKTGKVIPEVKTKVKPKPIITKHKEIINISNVAKSFSDAVQKVKKAVKKTSIPKKVSVKAIPIKQTSNLTALQNLLNASLVEQVKRNMGNGTRRDVLNLQTGRFAESVEITRMSESRQGMITAFYTYMKNPYATFSAGGRQEYPRSRDPKLLIAKSIREIAAQQVGNRLRSVLV